MVKMDIGRNLLADCVSLVFLIILVVYAVVKSAQITIEHSLKVGGLKYENKDGKTRYYKIIETDFDTYTKLVSDYENKKGGK
jgi:hypothetical protein